MQYVYLPSCVFLSCRMLSCLGHHTYLTNVVQRARYVMRVSFRFYTFDKEINL